MKKWWMVLAVLLLAACMASAAAEEWALEGDVLLYYSGAEASVSVPEGVREISPYAFCANSTLKEITLPSTLRIVGECAFAGCTQLETVRFEPGVEQIGQSAFYNCASLTELVLPEGLASIGSEAFAHCVRLREVAVPQGVAGMGQRAFHGCRLLRAVHLPNSLTEVGNHLLPEGVQVVLQDNEALKAHFEALGHPVSTAQKLEYSMAQRENRLVYHPEQAENGDVWITSAGSSTQMCSSDYSVIYYGSMAVDIDDTTAWQFKTNEVSTLSDAYLDLWLLEPCAINALRIKAGHWGEDRGGEDLYRQKGRPTKIELSFRCGASEEYTDPVVLTIPDRVKGEFTTLTFDWRLDVACIRMRILEVESGSSKYRRDVAVSEVRAVGAPMSRVPYEIQPAAE